MDGLRGVPSPDRAMAFDDSDYMLWSVFKCFVLLWCMVVPGGSSVLGLADVPLVIPWQCCIDRSRCDRF